MRTLSTYNQPLTADYSTGNVVLRFLTIPRIIHNTHIFRGVGPCENSSGKSKSTETKILEFFKNTFLPPLFASMWYDWWGVFYGCSMDFMGVSWVVSMVVQAYSRGALRGAQKSCMFQGCLIDVLYAFKGCSVKGVCYLNYWCCLKLKNIYIM